MFARNCLVSWIGMLAALGVWPACVVAQTRSATTPAVNYDPTQAGREALRETKPPWYERNQDRLRPVSPESSPRLARHRASTWERQVPKWSRSRWRWPKGLTRVIGWSFLALLATGLLVSLIWAYRRSESQRGGRSTLRPEQQQDLTARFEDLPFVLDAEKPDLLTEARYRFQQGDYQRTIVLLFSYELISLDQRQLIVLTKGKTNRQYLYELRGRPRLRDILDESMTVFERAYFGGQIPSRTELERCWEQLDEFHRALEPVPA